MRHVTLAMSLKTGHIYHGLYNTLILVFNAELVCESGIYGSCDPAIPTPGPTFHSSFTLFLSLTFIRLLVTSPYLGVRHLFITHFLVPSPPLLPYHLLSPNTL